MSLFWALDGKGLNTDNVKRTILSIFNKKSFVGVRLLKNLGLYLENI